MYTRMTWNPSDPAPYESGWCIFAKLMALNFCSPAYIASAIKFADQKRRNHLNFRDSSWIDFDRFGELLGVAPNRLRAGFLDQLGFPLFNYEEKRGIRYCPECLTVGYHNVLFDLALVTECPIHHRQLEKACPACFKTVYSKGLIRSPRPYRIPGGAIGDSEWDSDLYSSSCGHISFEPDLVMRISKLDDATRQQIRTSCECVVQWWSRVFSSPIGHTEFIAQLVRGSFDRSDERELGVGLDIATSVAGPFPWRASVEPISAEWLRCQTYGVAEKGYRLPFDSDLGKTYRAIRRHLFSKYVIRSHKLCWLEMSNYEQSLSWAISMDKVCPAVLAYMAWRMSIEEFSNIESFQHRGPISPTIRSMIHIGHSASAIANFWYAQFFAIHGKIKNELKKGGHFFIERYLMGSHYCGSASLLPDEGTQQGHFSGTWWIAYPSKSNLTGAIPSQCLLRMKRDTETMINEETAYQVMTWGWTGSYSENSRPNMLFRVRDDLTIRRYSRSHRYIYV